MRGVVLLLASLLCACAEEPTPEELQAQAEREIALVERGNSALPPLQEVTPDPIAYADIERHDLLGAGCSYAPGTSFGTRVIAKETDAYMKIDGEIVRFSPDPGARELPLGSRSRYIGPDYELSLELVAESEPSELEPVDYEGTVTLRDPYERIVYEGTGPAQCGS